MTKRPPEPLTDDSRMIWGKHKGWKLGKIPASYFLWLAQQTWLPEWPLLHAYVQSNMTRFEAEVAEEAGDEDDGEREFGTYQDFLDNR